MLYASTKESFKRELDGIQVELQATDPSEMDLDVIKGRANWLSSIYSSLRSDLWNENVYSLWYGGVYLP